MLHHCLYEAWDIILFLEDWLWVIIALEDCLHRSLPRIDLASQTGSGRICNAHTLELGSSLQDMHKDMGL